MANKQSETNLYNEKKKLTHLLTAKKTFAIEDETAICTS